MFVPGLECRSESTVSATCEVVVTKRCSYRRKVSRVNTKNGEERRERGVTGHTEEHGKEKEKKKEKMIAGEDWREHKSPGLVRRSANRYQTEECVRELKYIVK